MLITVVKWFLSFCSDIRFGNSNKFSVQRDFYRTFNLLYWVQAGYKAILRNGVDVMHFGLIDYTYLDKVQGSDHRRHCIDGRITGRGNCVGYCQFTKHPGFLTARHCAEHHCTEKGCHYFLPKPKQEKVAAKCHDTGTEIVMIATLAISAFEGMKIMRADKADDGWRLKYITLSDAYPISRIAENISEAVGEAVVMIRLDYDFELTAQLIFSN